MTKFTVENKFYGKHLAYRKIGTRDPSGTLQKPKIWDPGGTLQKPENWDPIEILQKPENQDPGH